MPLVLPGGRSGGLEGSGAGERIVPGSPGRHKGPQGSTSPPKVARQPTLVGSDGLHGPTLDGAVRRAVLLAFIDDHSRLLVGWRWGAGEDVVRLEAALRPALMARGIP